MILIFPCKSILQHNILYNNNLLRNITKSLIISKVFLKNADYMGNQRNTINRKDLEKWDWQRHKQDFCA